MTQITPAVGKKSALASTSTALAIWSTIGALAVATQAYIYIRWIAAGDAKPIPTNGAEEVLTSTKVWAWLIQGGVLAMGITVVVWISLQCYRKGRLTLDGMLLIAWLSMMWQDPIINYVRTSFFYSSYLLNVGTWSPYIPGWMSPNAGNLPQPIAISGIGYLMSIPACVFITYLMRRAKDKWPDISGVKLFGIAFTFGAVLELAFELACVRTGLYSYSGAVHSLSAWGGNTYQFPVYEAVLIGALWGAIATLRYYTDDRGRTMVERGSASLAPSRRGTVLRTLALVGFVNVGFMIYNLVTVWFTLQMDATPGGFPLHLLNDMCGTPASGYECPTPDLPIPIYTNPTP